MSKRKLVLIQWEDSASPMSGSWQDADQIINKPVTVTSVGYVMKEGKRAVTVASHLAGERTLHCVNGLMTIPKSCILKRKEL